MKCPKHGTQMYETDWRPPKGINQSYRQFKCGFHNCAHIEYKPVKVGKKQ